MAQEIPLHLDGLVEFSHWEALPLEPTAHSCCIIFVRVFHFEEPLFGALMEGIIQGVW